MIPEQILKNKKLLHACLGGLFDTDGFAGKSGNRFKVVFSSSNPLLSKQVASYLFSIGLLKKDIPKENLEISNHRNIIKYFNLIGSSNLRHIVRFIVYKDTKKLLYKREVRNYYNDYAMLKIPFHGPIV